MDFISVLSISSIIINLILFFLIKRAASSTYITQYLLSLLYFFLALWGVTQLLNYHFSDNEYIIFSVRIAYSLVLCIVLITFMISSAFTKNQRHINNILNKYSYLIFIISSLFQIIVKEIKVIDREIVTINNNAILIIYIIILTTFILLTINKIFSIINTSDNDTLKYSFILFTTSILFTFIIGIIFNFFLPTYLTDYNKSSPLYGFNSSVIFSISSYYIFSRTRYYPIRRYLFLIIKYAINFLLIFLFIQTVLSSYLWQEQILILVIILVIIHFSYNYLISILFSSYTQKDKLLNDKVMLSRFLESNNLQELYENIRAIISEYTNIDSFSIIYRKAGLIRIFGKQLNTTIINKIIQFKESFLIVSEESIKKDKSDLSLYIENNLEILSTIYETPIIKSVIIFYSKSNNQIYTIEDLNLITTINYFSKIIIDKLIINENINNFNITLKDQVQEQTKKLQIAYEKLKQVDLAKSDFISIASHQLRTPLSIIKGYLSMLHDGDYGEVGEKQKGILKMTMNSVIDLGEIVNELLTSSRIERGKFSLMLSEFDLIPLLNSIYELYSNKYDIKKLEFKVIVPKNKPQIIIRADREKLQQVIINLIENAYNYTPSGKVELKVSDTKTSTIIAVKDTGIGIPPEGQEKLFERFSRLPNAQNLRPDGTGIGLFTAKVIMTKHKGKIWFESKLGKGTTFYIEIPKRK